MAEQQIPGTNPALSQLAALVGDWQTKLSNASFLPDPSATVRGHTSFHWFDEGAFLVMRQSDTPTNAPRALWVIGRDETQGEYEVLYFDTRPMSRVYRMSFDGKTWKMWREAPGFWQRFECSVGDDGGTMTGYWEKSTDDGSSWERDFDVAYTKE
jgi:hypothetical protein